MSSIPVTVAISMMSAMSIKVIAPVVVALRTRIMMVAIGITMSFVVTRSVTIIMRRVVSRSILMPIPPVMATRVPDYWFAVVTIVVTPDWPVVTVRWRMIAIPVTTVSMFVVMPVSHQRPYHMTQID